MLLSLALCLLAQNPTFHWDKSVDQKYWQALHLLEIDEQASEAAAIFQELVDEPSVIQYRGQAGYVLAQAYRALLASGRKDAATALLPTIRREIAGTEYEQLANALLASAKQSASQTEELDPDFMEWVQRELVNPANQSQDVNSRVHAYGKRLVPYLLSTIENAEPNQWNIHGAFALGVQLEDSGFYQRCLELISERDTKFSERLFNRIWLVFPLEGNVIPKLAGFMVEVSKDPRLLVAQPALDWLARAAAFDPIALARVEELLEEEANIKGQLLIEEIQLNGFAGASAIVIAAVESTNQEHAATARQVAFEHGGYMQALHHFSEDGDRDATKALLSRMCKTGNGVSYKNVRSYWDNQTLAIGPRVELGYGVPSWLAKTPKEPMDDYLEDWHDMVVKTIRAQDKELALAAFLIALQQGDWVPALEYLDLHGSPPALPFILPISYPAEFAPYLEKAVANTEQGWMAAQRLLDSGNPLNFESLKVLCGEEKFFQPLAAVIKGWEASSETLMWAESLALDPKTAPGLRNYLFSFVAKRTAVPSQALLKGIVDLPLSEKQRSDFLVSWWDFSLRDLLEADLSTSKELSSDAVNAFISYMSMARKVEWKGDPSDLRWLRYATNLIYFQRNNGVNFDDVLLPLLTSEESVLFWDRVHPGSFLTSPAQLQVALSLASDYVAGWNAGRFSMMSSESVLVLLDHPDIRVRQTLLRLLSLHRLSEDAKVLQKAIPMVSQSMSEPALASYAAKALVELGAEEGYVPKLLEAWEFPDLEERALLIEAIGGIYDERLLPVLLEAIQFPERRVAKAGEKALDRYLSLREKHKAVHAWERAGREGSPVDHLIAQLAHAELEVRVAAAESLGTLQAKEALPFLVDLLTAEEEEIADAARVALRRINHADSVDESGESGSGE